MARRIRGASSWLALCRPFSLYGELASGALIPFLGSPFSPFGAGERSETERGPGWVTYWVAGNVFRGSPLSVVARWARTPPPWGRQEKMRLSFAPPLWGRQEGCRYVVLFLPYGGGKKSGVVPRVFFLCRGQEGTAAFYRRFSASRLFLQL